MSMRHLENQIEIAAAFVEQTWRAVVLGSRNAPPGAPTLKFDRLEQREEYAASIVSTEVLNMPHSGRFVRDIVSTRPIAKKTENGYPAWDMKPMLLGGSKVRLSSKGKRYNVIPFRHGAPGSQRFRSMPADVHAAASQLRAGSLPGNLRGLKGSEFSALGRSGGEALVGTERRFPPLAKKFRDGFGRVRRYQHRAGRFEGMIKSQKQGHSQYVTLRTVSENSDPNAWWHPGRPPQPHIDWVSRYCKAKIEPLLRRAAEADLVSGAALTVGMSVTKRG